MTVRILQGDCRELLAAMPEQSVHCCVTSPPYYGLRDYGVDGQIGNEDTPDDFVEQLVLVFREVRRVLRDDGTLWVNIGDTYTPVNYGANSRPRREQATDASAMQAGHWHADRDGERSQRLYQGCRALGLKQKDLIGVPWMLAFALRADGWYLRKSIIWAKPNGMPESVRDRPSSSHENVFLLSKSPSYYYDNETARTPAAPATQTRLAQNVEAQAGSDRANGGGKTNGPMKAVSRKVAEGNPRKIAAAAPGIDDRKHKPYETANLRDVWWLSPAQSRDGHYAVMPDALAEICILAGCPEGGTVLDPFSGAGTTGLVADRHQRNAILCELNPAYVEIAERRVRGDAPLLAEVEAA